MSEKELMLLIILPLAKKGKEVKQKVIEQVVDLAKTELKMKTHRHLLSWYFGEQ